MSLDGFRRAFAHFVASPARCLELRADPSLLEPFALDAREHERLLAMVRHAGMSHHCTLYRANRLTAIARSLPQTCEQLGIALSGELNRFWGSSTEAELQFRREAERFAHWLLGRIAHGAVGTRRWPHRTRGGARARHVLRRRAAAGPRLKSRAQRHCGRDARLATRHLREDELVPTSATASPRLPRPVPLKGGVA